MAKGWSAIPLESMFELSTTKHLRGHNLKLVKHRSNLELRRNFFTERLINRRNSLDQQSLDVDTVNCFKNHLQRLRNTRMGFFVDWSNPLAAQVLTGVATPGKWPGKYTNWTSDWSPSVLSSHTKNKCKSEIHWSFSSKHRFTSQQYSIRNHYWMWWGGNLTWCLNARTAKFFSWLLPIIGQLFVMHTLLTRGCVSEGTCRLCPMTAGGVNGSGFTSLTVRLGKVMVVSVSHLPP